MVDFPAPHSGVAGAPARSIVQFKEVFLTPRYLAIAMEFVAGGDMFEYVVRKGGLKESEARWFFQQLIVGVDYLHRMVRRPPGLRLSAVTRGWATAEGECVCVLWLWGCASRGLAAGQRLQRSPAALYGSQAACQMQLSQREGALQWEQVRIFCWVQCQSLAMETHWSQSTSGACERHC